MPALSELKQFDQSVWFDFIRRSLITSGELARLAVQGVQGVTSNPAIFEKAIAGSSDYDEEMKTLITAGKSVPEIYETLAIKDIQLAADVMRSVYDATGGRDGYVSLETVNTMPPETVKAFIDHGRPTETLTQALATARKQVGRLAELGIDFDGVTRRLQEEGVAAFAKPFQSLMDSIDAKRRRLMA